MPLSNTVESWAQKKTKEREGGGVGFQPHVSELSVLFISLRYFWGLCASLSPSTPEHPVIAFSLWLEITVQRKVQVILKTLRKTEILILWAVMANSKDLKSIPICDLWGLGVAFYEMKAKEIHLFCQLMGNLICTWKRVIALSGDAFAYIGV